MRNARISLLDLPPEGRHMELEDQTLWTHALQEFHMECRITAPLHLDITLLPTGEGVLARGRLTGEIVVPCGRCAEDAPVHLNHVFEFFEPLPEQSVNSGEDEFFPDEPGLISLEQGIPMLDITALCWEEFVLALPVKPLCREDCKGLCPSCGANLNMARCTCSQEEGDPRLAALRSLKITSPAQ